jgi:hypothetical protein
MSDRSKERLANFLMEELLDRLGGRADIKAMLGEMSGLPIDELIQQLLDDFAHVLEKRYVEYAQTLQTRHRDEEAATPRRDVPAPQRVAPEPGPHPEPAKEETPLPPPEVTPTVHERMPPEREQLAPHKPLSVDIRPLAARTESPDPDLHAIPPTRADRETDTFMNQTEVVSEAASVPSSGSDKKTEPPLVDKDEKPELTERQRVLFEGITQEKLPCEFADDDAVYMYAVATVRPGETEEPTPFLLEEKGIGGKEFAFALDHGGLRFYLSKVNMSEVSLSRGGLLLHGKQESLQMQGAHENIVNELRAHGRLLPFIPGTVARTKDEFFSRIDDHLDALKSALLELSVTKWWALTLSVLDFRMAQLVGTGKPIAERDLGARRRSSASIPPARTYDIKLLEKMLQKEKKIAEAVHEHLEAIAERVDVDYMIGIGGGSSEDWKPILKASYEVNHGQLPAFYRKVTDQQYQYMLFDLMFSLQGNRGAYSFAES